MQFRWVFIFLYSLTLRLRWNSLRRFQRSSGIPMNFVPEGGQQIQFRTERTGIWGRLPPSQGFWGQLKFVTRNFISYSKTFLIFGTLRLFMMTTNLFVIANVKQLRTGGSFIILLLFPNIFGCWRPKFRNF